MEDLVETLTRGNVTEVKVLLASICLALGVYQLVMVAVGYGWLRVRALGSPAALTAHRAAGDAIALMLLITGVMCLSVYGFEAEDGAGTHIVAGSALLSVLAVKILVVRRDFGLGRFLPVLGVCVFALIAVTWATSAGDLLADR